MKLIPFLNLGNTCYINSVVQCFINDTYFNDILNNNSSNNNLLLSFKSVINESLTDLSSIINFFPHFKRLYQQDSHEFLMCLLDSLVIFRAESVFDLLLETISVEILRLSSYILYY